MHRTLAFLVLGLAVVTGSASASEETTPSAATSAVDVENVPPAAVVDWSLPPIEIGAAERPKLLPVLYVSLVALQAFDGYSTTAGLARGAQEANPLMGGVARNSAAFWAVKAGSTAASIWLAERMWKRNKVGAIVTMAIMNGVMASVAAQNASVLRGVR